MTRPSSCSSSSWSVPVSCVIFETTRFHKSETVPEQQKQHLFNVLFANYHEVFKQGSAAAADGNFESPLLCKFCDGC